MLSWPSNISNYYYLNSSESSIALTSQRVEEQEKLVVLLVLWIAHFCQMTHPLGEDIPLLKSSKID